VPFERNSNDFVFDNQILVQSLAAGARIGELSCPTRYQADSSSINLRRSIRYGVGVLQTSVQYRLHQRRIRRYSYLDIDPARALPGHSEATGVAGAAAAEAEPASRGRSGNS
jgi:hypothetical protein